MKKQVNREQIIKLHQEGVSYQNIAESVGCSKSTVGKVLNEAGCSAKIFLDKGKVLALHRAGWKVKDIAGDMGITEEDVREVLTAKKEVPRD